jgi:hypothetical protein
MASKKLVDLALVEDALKRAAKTAVFGSREARSGRFLGSQNRASLSSNRSDLSRDGKKTSKC